jgi:hypothetical protein
MTIRTETGRPYSHIVTFQYFDTLSSANVPQSDSVVTASTGKGLNAMNKMYFWRDKNFHSLTEAASFSAEIPDWKDYSEYCSLLERGLRKDALSHLAKFIDSAISWNFSQKRHFVSWLFHFAHTNPDCFQLMPQHLSKRLLEPTLTEWAEREPSCAEPYRWLGTHEHLRQAIELEPKDEIAQ